jgi:hypothetical protein
MYKFSKMQNSDGTWRFELEGVSIIVDGFRQQDGKHIMLNPLKAIAFIDVNGNMYGVSNQYNIYHTVEEFFDMMKEQAVFFADKDKSKNEHHNKDSEGQSFSQPS